ncbi:unnamed protein product [Penicillium salamii]|nr:unnamed protein product [Penicillium salamii]CAG8377194.1 unnamed protein product [Penicillium salamii]
MELAQDQLARPLPPLSGKAGFSTSSRNLHRVGLTFMSEWHTFTTDALKAFREARITHEVPLHDETEIYSVGNKVGVTARFIQNLCNPVRRALEPSLGTAAIHFADFQAISFPVGILPDICLGLVSIPGLKNVHLVIDLKTPWTIDDPDLRLNILDRSHYLEPLIGQVVAQMRMCSLRFGVLSTYQYTVFVKRVADTSFLLSPPIEYDAVQPSLRQLFTGFCLMALGASKYHESPSFNPRNVTTGGLCHSVTRFYDRLFDDLDDPSLPLTSESGSITPGSVVVRTDSAHPVIINCIRQLSNLKATCKATWLATMNGSQVILKCWHPKYLELFEAEVEVYQRIWTHPRANIDVFAKWHFSGEIICSSIFPSGYVLVLQHRNGVQLEQIWDTLSEAERAHVQSQCLGGIYVLREVAVRLYDTGIHNILYCRDSRELTLIDFEIADVEPESDILTDQEMRRIFRPHLFLHRAPSG